MKNWKFYAKYVQENPAYSGIHDREQTKARRKKMKKFKKKYGFEYSDIWNFDHTLAALFFLVLLIFEIFIMAFLVVEQRLMKMGKQPMKSKLLMNIRKSQIRWYKVFTCTCQKICMR